MPGSSWSGRWPGPKSRGGPEAVGEAACGCDQKASALRFEILCSRSARRRIFVSLARGILAAGSWTPSRIIDWAEKTGPSTAALVDAIMKERRRPEQGYRLYRGPIAKRQTFSKSPNGLELRTHVREGSVKCVEGSKVAEAARERTRAV